MRKYRKLKWLNLVDLGVTVLCVFTIWSGTTVSIRVRAAEVEDVADAMS
jgi:hypothetical protein